MEANHRLKQAINPSEQSEYFAKLVVNATS